MARIVIDVRSPAEYQSAHAQRTKNIPLNQLKAKIAKVAQPTDEIWVCCASGSRSSQAMRELKALGYRRLRDIGSWKNLK
jgi:phage shock protein E